MTEEEYFRKNYPDYCYGNRLLSPYWDLFQDGVEFGERQSEKKIEELEKNLKLWTDTKDARETIFFQQKRKIAELEQENRGIKTCANCDEYVIGRCCNYPNGVCHHWKLSEKYRNDDELTKVKKQIEKVEYTLKKIIETVQNDRIDEYGARLVLIKDFAYECLEEIEK